MATFFQIPVNKNLPRYVQRIALSKVTYTLLMDYNTRADRWFLSIMDSIGTPIVMGLPLLVMRDVLGPYKTRPIPPGSLFAVDYSGRDLEPGLSDFLLNHGVVYLDPT